MPPSKKRQKQQQKARKAAAARWTMDTNVGNASTVRGKGQHTGTATWGMMEPSTESVPAEVKEEPTDNQVTSSHLPSSTGVDRVRDAARNGHLMMNPIEDHLKVEVKEEPFDDQTYAALPPSFPQQASGVGRVSDHPEYAITQCGGTDIKEEDVWIKDEPLEDSDLMTGNTTTFTPKPGSTGSGCKRKPKQDTGKAKVVKKLRNEGNVQTKYTNLQTSLKDELRRLTKPKSGSAGKKESMDSQWPLIELMLSLKDLVEVAPSLSTCSDETEAVRCDVDTLITEMSLHEDQQAASPSDLASPGSCTPDVVKIIIGRNTTQVPTSSVRASSLAVETPSKTPSRTPTPQEIPTPHSSQPPTPASTASQPLSKRGRVKGKTTSTDSEPTTQNILNCMASAISNINTKTSIAQISAALVKCTCEKLPFINQVRLLQKLATVMEAEMMEAGLAE